MILRHAFAIICVFIFASPASVSSANAQAYLPSMKIGTAPLVSPSSADSFYGTSTAATHRAGYNPAPPEIVALARGLKNDPDLIYQYVRNNVDVVWEYGLQKGALGASIDKSGTPFDQAALMIAVLRQAGFTAGYEAGTVVLNGAQFQAWTNVSDATAACLLLSGGGIPAEINGSSPSNCAYGTGTAITSVRMAHIWVKVAITGSSCGSSCIFDPSYKPYSWLPGINLAGATGFTAGAGLNAAAGPGSGANTGTAFSMPYAQNLNASALNSLLASYASNLQTYLKNNNLGGAQMEGIVSGGVIQPAAATPLRQTSLPYQDSAPPYAVHDWSDIPDRYRTTLEVSGTMRNVNSSGPPETLFDTPFFVDEIYGRRLTIGTNFNSNSLGQPSDFNTFTTMLELDDQILSSHTMSGTVTPTEHYPAAITITANHPYAAQVNGTPGDYMDVTITKDATLVTPISVVMGWGDTGPALLSKWSSERVEDLAAPGRLNQTCPTECPQPIYQSPIGDYSREKAQAAYLGQYTRAARLHAALANGIEQTHHVLGLIYADDYVDDDGASHPPGQTPNFFVTDSFTRVDVDTGLSFASKTNDAAGRRATVQAIAATSAMLEGATVAQIADVPDTASTASRFEWANNPTCVTNAAPYWNCEDPSGGTPRNFFQFSPSSTVPGSWVLWENQVTPPAPNTGNDPLGAPQNWAPDEMNALTNFIGAYTAAGFTVTASQESFLGPGQRGGYIKVNSIGSGNYSYVPAWTKQRGGAFVATRFDANGDPVEIAHDVVGLIAPDSSGHLTPTKGGGGGTPPDNAPTYNPATAADILKSRFVDRSNLLGVDLANGSMSYQSPATISVGNGGFPYEISASHSFHQGALPTTDFGPIFPGSPAGWISNWYNSLSISSSGAEGMGASDIRAASSAIAAFMVAQDIYRSAPGVSRDTAAVLTQSWLMRQFSGNSVSVTVGGGTKQFVRVPDGSYVAPGSTKATLAITGSRAPFTFMCPSWSPSRGAQYALSRGWDNSLLAGTSGTTPITITNANGDKQIFKYWLQHYQTSDIGVGSECGRASGFRLESWTFPQGMSVTLNYTTGGGATSDGSAKSSSPNAIVSYPSSTTLASVSNSIGRSLTFATDGSNTVSDGSRTLLGPHMYTDGSFGVTDPVGDITAFSFGPAMITSATQRPVPYQQLTQIHSPFNAAIAPNPGTLDLQYDFDALGQVFAVHDAVSLQQPGTRSPYTFFLADNTRGERDDPLGNGYKVVYDTYKHPYRYIDELGRETGALFDSRSRPVNYTYPELDQEQFGYSDDNNVTSFTKVAKPGSGLANLVVSATWDPTWNKPLNITNARGVTTNFTYYGSGATGASLMATAVRPADGYGNGAATYGFTYTAIGQPSTATDPDNVVTQSAYDSSGDLTSSTVDPSGLAIVTGYGYDGIGNVTSTIDPRGFVLTSIFDADRRKTEDDHHNGDATAALLTATQSIYDAWGRVTDVKSGKTFSGASVASWYDHPVHTTYTPTSKAATVTDADQRLTATTYDALDRVDTVLDPIGRATHKGYDAAGELLVESRGWGTPLVQAYATHSYTLNGKEASVFDALGAAHTTTYSYDGFDRLLRTTYADTSHEDLSFDANGNILTRTNRSGQTLTYAYDLLDRLRTKAIPAGAANTAHSIATSYTLAGRTSGMTDTAGPALAYTFDTAGRATSESEAALGTSRTVGWQLDKAGNHMRLTWPDFFAVDYSYDALNRMNGAAVHGGAALAAYSYDPLSRRTSLSYNSGTSSVSYSYSDAGDMLSLSNSLAGGAGVGYSASYTPAHQLASQSADNSTYVWTAPTTGSDSYAAVNSLNQYPSVNGNALGWDGNGNLSGYGGQALMHDPENRLVAVQPSGTSLAYTYDPLGRRSIAAKAVVAGPLWGAATWGAFTWTAASTANTVFLHDGDSEIAEYDTSGALIRRFVPGATIDEPVAMITAAGTTSFFHTDRQGSVIAMADTGGNRVEGPYTYDAYGNCFVGTTTTSCTTLAFTTEPYRYTGQRFDADTGLHYYRARYYHAGLGRFVETDPAGYKPDVNWYAYVGNDPANNTDSSGRACDDICDPTIAKAMMSPEQRSAEVKMLAIGLPLTAGAAIAASVGSPVIGAIALSSGIGGSISATTSTAQGKTSGQVVTDTGKGMIASGISATVARIGGVAGVPGTVSGEITGAYAGAKATGSSNSEAVASAAVAGVVGLLTAPIMSPNSSTILSSTAARLMTGLIKSSAKAETKALIAPKGGCQRAEGVNCGQ
jgi:RHS repeat-associated protein